MRVAQRTKDPYPSQSIVLEHPSRKKMQTLLAHAGEPLHQLLQIQGKAHSTEQALLQVLLNQLGTQNGPQQDFTPPHTPPQQPLNITDLLLMSAAFENTRPRASLEALLLQSLQRTPSPAFGYNLPTSNPQLESLLLGLSQQQGAPRQAPAKPNPQDPTLQFLQDHPEESGGCSSVAPTAGPTTGLWDTSETASGAGVVEENSPKDWLKRTASHPPSRKRSRVGSSDWDNSTWVETTTNPAGLSPVSSSPKPTPPRSPLSGRAVSPIPMQAPPMPPIPEIDVKVEFHPLTRSASAPVPQVKGPAASPQGMSEQCEEVLAPPVKQRAKRGRATDPHSINERIRRERIADRLRILATLIPGGDRIDKATMLEEVISYVRFLQLQVKLLNVGHGSWEKNLAQAPSETSPAEFLAPEEQQQVEQELGHLMQQDVASAMHFLHKKGLCLAHKSILGDEFNS